MFKIDLVKKRLLIPIIAALSYLSLAPSAFAQIVTCPLAPFNALCFQEGSLAGIIGAFVSFIFIVAVVIALFYLLFGAVKWIFSGGDKAAIESARGTIVAAVIGLIILFLTFLLVNILLGFFNVNVANFDITPIPTP
jgi:hypothetical protein